jgi:hypothetical protein
MSRFMGSGQFGDQFAERVASRFGVNSLVTAVRLDRDEIWPAA